MFEDLQTNNINNEINQIVDTVRSYKLKIFTKIGAGASADYHRSF